MLKTTKKNHVSVALAFQLNDVSLTGEKQGEREAVLHIVLQRKDFPSQNQQSLDSNKSTQGHAKK